MFKNNKLLKILKILLATIFVILMKLFLTQDLEMLKNYIKLPIFCRKHIKLIILACNLGQKSIINQKQ